MNLKEIEARLQSLIEVDLLSILPGRKMEDVIVQKLAAAIQHNTATLEDGSVAAPNVFTLVLHPEESIKWRNAQFIAILSHSITTVAQEAGFGVTISPAITVSTDPKIPLNDAQIVASYRMDDSMSQTNATPLDTGNLEEANPIPENAFLIVEGVKVFPLKLPVVNIGRRLDNQLVVDDPRVSRAHAQLRAIKGRFVVFDLNSTGGTFVNGQRASQVVLYPGDVISLAGVALIFGQDNPPPRLDLKDTAPFPKIASDRPTATLKDHSTAKLKKK
ncbi:MAG: FHA domain-containing protein [Chloroflexi bacterium]|nr:FHA domain-containing protein [Chloroflexota bacterium]